SLLRFAASIPLLYAYPGINYLFIWWLFVSLLEYFSIQYKTWSIIPVKVNFFIFDFLSIKKRWKMIVALASTSLIWV
ncbi:O-antigen transporter, partial [Escherichia coli]|nr:O-antigen transporter [Escherichia coli]